VGNLPFRRICKGFGVDITCGEMAMCNNLLEGQMSEWALTQRHSSEDIFGVQIAGSNPGQVIRTCEAINNLLQVDFVDLNCGCPIDIVYNRGAGSALLEKPSILKKMTYGASAVLDVPFTVKLRVGRDETKPTIHNQIPLLGRWGASAVTLHGRSREQRYNRAANWEYVARCSELAPIPFIGNGDIYNFEEAVEHWENSKASALMIARGALFKPWLFQEIKERRSDPLTDRHIDISSAERWAMYQNFINYGLEHWGSDSQGFVSPAHSSVEKTREFFLNFLSFSHRYVPIGLLERLPSYMSQRSARFQVPALL
jgi:tRNA-dihydrouridine synthase 3